jgi:hypothetical protein
MRRLGFILAAFLPAAAGAQAIVSSPAPDSVAVTVYRDPNRNSQEFDSGWLGGIALVSEKRRVSLPAGETELRFEGVTSGLIPQSAIVTGLGEAVLEKNRDARLLSPGALLDAYLGQRVFLKRTSKVTGETRQQEAVIRATAEGVVVQSAEGIEALRCTGIPETLIAPSVPADLSAKPTLSVRVRSPRPVEADITLSYLTNNFDWQANYVGELSDDGRRLNLFGWLTMANGDETGLTDAATQAVAGKVNYQRVEVPEGEAKRISIQCWPQGKTSDIPIANKDDGESIVVTGSRISMNSPVASPPPPPPSVMAERGGDEEVMAKEERLGDVRLYRIPIAVTVAAFSQKQVALLKQPTVRVESLFRLRPEPGDRAVRLERVLVTRNRPADGLGLALPAGRLTLFGRKDGRRILIGEGSIDDYTVGEKVEFRVGFVPPLLATQVAVPNESGNFELTVSNDSREPQIVEIELPLEARALQGGKLVKRDGWQLWRRTVPANGSVTLKYRFAG